MKKYIFCILLSTLLFSCKDEKIFNGTDVPSTSAAFSFTVADFESDISVDSRGYVEGVEENDLKNIWLLMFDADGKRIDPDSDVSVTYTNPLNNNTVEDNGNELYNTANEIRQGVDEKDEIYGSTYIASYTPGDIIYVNQNLSQSIASIRVIGNIFKLGDKTDDDEFDDEDNYYDDFLSANCETLTDYQSKCFSLKDNVNRENDMWYEVDEDGDGVTDNYYLRMAGNWDGTIPDPGLTFCLGVLAKPMAAKITVSYICHNDETTLNVANGEGIRIVSMQVKRVPQNVYYKDIDNPSAHYDNEYTSYMPRTVYNDPDEMGDYEGGYTFYVPQNLRGEVETNLTASDKTANAPEDATSVALVAMYKGGFNDDTWGYEERPIYIELYPGEDLITDYNIKMRRHYHITVDITATNETVSWETDARVYVDEVLPTGPIVHYEFSTSDKTYNSAYDANGNLLNMSYFGDKTENSNYIVIDENYKDSISNYLTYIDTNGFYKELIYGFQTNGNNVSRWNNNSCNTVDIVAKDVDRPFIRNLATDNREYDNYKNYGVASAQKHPQVFDCTFIKDNSERYASSYGYSTELVYYEGNNFINSSLLQLCTGWGYGIDPCNDEYTIVFIGSVGKNNAHGSYDNDRGVYYGNYIEENDRWYFYKNYEYITYGLGATQTEEIDDLTATNYQNVQCYDICRYKYDDVGLQVRGNTERKVYYNNVDVVAVDIPETTTDSSDDLTITSTSDFIFDSPIYIFGHTTDTNKDDAVDGRLRLFLIYDRALTLDDIDQIRRYAALKGLLSYGELDTDEYFMVDPGLTSANDSNSDWSNGGGGSSTIGDSN